MAYHLKEAWYGYGQLKMHVTVLELLFSDLELVKYLQCSVFLLPCVFVKMYTGESQITRIGNV